MIRRALLGCLVLVAAEAVAVAAPRVGVVVVDSGGIAEDKADEVAYDLAGAIATQIEGEAIAGATVRDGLADAPPGPDCYDNPDCGRALATRLKTDEVLLLLLKKDGKATVVTARRVPRDPAKSGSDGELHLSGKVAAKRAQAVTDGVNTLFPAGSVVVFVEPAPVKVESAPAKNTKSAAAATDDGSITSKKWFLPVVAGGVVVIGLAIGLGVGFGYVQGPTGPTITLP